MLTAAPQSALPRKKTATAISRIVLRPQMSLNLPQLGATTAAASRNDEPIHVYPDVERKCSEIVGTAVETMVMSRAARKTADWYAVLAFGFVSSD